MIFQTSRRVGTLLSIGLKKDVGLAAARAGRTAPRRRAARERRASAPRASRDDSPQDRLSRQVKSGIPIISAEKVLLSISNHFANFVQNNSKEFDRF